MKLFVMMLLAMMITGPAMGKRKIKGCKGRDKAIIASNFTFAKNHWRAFERYAQRRMNINIKKCLKNRFKKNGKIICEKKDKGKCKGANGWASAFNKKAHICPSFRRQVRSLPTVEAQKTCYFALMVHEFAHTCFRGHRKVEPLDNLAFDFAARRFGASVDMLRDCRMD